MLKNLLKLLSKSTSKAYSSSSSHSFVLFPLDIINVTLKIACRITFMIKLC